MRNGRLIDCWPVKPKPSSEGEFVVVGDALRKRQNLSARKSGDRFCVFPANLSQVCRQPMRASAKSTALPSRNSTPSR